MGGLSIKLPVLRQGNLVAVVDVLQDGLAVWVGLYDVNDLISKGFGFEYIESPFKLLVVVHLDNETHGSISVFKQVGRRLYNSGSWQKVFFLLTYPVLRESGGVRPALR